MIECIPRLEGTSYPAAIGQMLGVRQWTAMAWKKAPSFICFDLTGVEFDHISEEGFILVNCGVVLVGKLLETSAGNPKR